MSDGTLNPVEEVLNLQTGDKASAKTKGRWDGDQERRLRGVFKEGGKGQGLAE